MDWLRRIANLLRPSGETQARSGEARDEPGAGPVERAAPGVAALLGDVRSDGSHAVLDLGPATGSSLQVYQRFARQVRFADLPAERSERGLAAALEAMPSQPDRPYDLVFAWDTLDRLLPRERSRLMQRLTDISAPDARLHVVIHPPEGGTRRRPLHFTLLDVHRMRCEPAGPPQPDRHRLQPADVEDLLAPFRVVRGFTLKGGLREYVAVRETRHDR